MPDNNGNPIAIHELAVAYGNHRVLDGLSLDVPASSITALLGGNGAGKSTTLSALLGFVRADAGQIAVCGIDPGADADAARRRIAYANITVICLAAVRSALRTSPKSDAPNSRGAATSA
ncbi:ATP-binding cassette domain-containing protein [Sphingomonas sp. LR55]|uniref:ATP-binding cassette domain-containing protein n=1 Tax=Sphingomonas sp. LR55 TaxID=3050231 RepID=UPI002FE2EBBF